MKTMLAALLLATTAIAADPPTHTRAPETARFEVLEGAKWTFRLDRNSGEIAQLTWLDGGKKSWTAMNVPGLDAGKKNKPRFQLFATGLSRYLLDTETGASWSLEETKDAAGKDAITWVAFTEPAAKK